ncbi:MAG: hypothetical protein ABH854_00010 [Candidatus Diapherotrites archaeon]
MGAKKKLVIAVFLLAVLAGAVYLLFFSGAGVPAKFAEFEAVNLKYAASGAMVPGNAQEISEYRAALKEFRSGIDNSAQGNALKLLIDARLIFADIEQDLTEAEGLMERVNFSAPDCSESGGLKEAVSLFEGVKSKSALALENLNILMRDYSGEAASFGIGENNAYVDAAAGAGDGADYFIDTLNSYCA